ncbi:hypothetical protein D9757_012786 [Collybiopsis confluens]|uniref:GDP/GTP exchange factor Sec2 N-terminal domain-containing protein n=1 Tax=Collybiopsis confluens TaxID=2823264 RepID=A0A8H5CXJ4_9AGAR|nr:hypothetical protein D9757_012786 [Collybiopsis confluens]
MATTPIAKESLAEEENSGNDISPSPAPAPTHLRGTSDDPQTQLIGTLRTQINDLFTQVTQLNSKLVSSYDRVSDLEDSLHVTSSNLRSSTLKISQLELERTQHLSALNTGLLVEKSQVTAELTRLMERATEEAASRSSAVQAKQDIEKELDDLSALLFDQANTMVAEARLNKAKEEEKRKEAERRLGEAEEVVQEMARTLRKAEQEREMRDKEQQWTVTKSKCASHPSTRLLSTHVPYQEFLLFVAHLRGLHSSTSQLPTMSTLLPLPFLARLMSEDSDPTLRLDLAPSLNWLSRRSVLAAIHTGNLTIEPIPTATLIQSYTSNSSSGSISSLPTGLNIGGLNSASAHSSLNCALCGTPVFPGLDLSLFNSSSSSSSSWFKRPSMPNVPSNDGNNGGQGITPPPSPPLRGKAPPMDPATILETLPSQVYVFRITPSTAPALSTVVPTSAPSTLAPLGGSGPPPVPPRASRTRSGTVSAASHMSVPSTSSSISAYSQASSTSKPPSSPFISVPSPTSKSHTKSLVSTSNSPIYPLCVASIDHASDAHSWCLIRLRATCSLWAFVRGGIVERVWDEEVAYDPPNAGTSGVGGMPPAPPMHPASNEYSTGATPSTPPRPPRKRGLWGTLGSLGERAANWGSGGSANISRPSTPGTEEREKQLPSVPAPLGIALSPPPPLPRRNEGRAKPSSSAVTAPTTGVAPTDTVPSSSGDEFSDDHNHHHEEGGSEVVFSVSPHQSPVSSPRLSQEAAKIPLPDSRPATPVTPTRRVMGAVPTTPSRTASPVPGGGSTAVPPPIPRRAVARGGSGSRPASISKPLTAVLPTATPEGKVELQSDDKDKVGEAKVERQVEAKEGVRRDSEERSKVEDTVMEKKADDDLTDAEHTTEVPEMEKTEEKKTEGEGTGAEKVDDKKGEHAPEGIAAQDSAGAVKAEDSQPEAKEVLTEEKEVDADGLVEPMSDQLSQDSDGVEKEGARYPYIGSTTWEERTWKEVIRLKEGMFWARVGGVQAE